MRPALEPGDYFKINTKADKIHCPGRRGASGRPLDAGPVQFDELKQDAGVKEELSGRTAGAVTLALGMAKILGDLPGMKPLMAYLYHFVIMFEVLFILTLLETGTRVTRFIVEEVIGQFRPGVSDRRRSLLVVEHCDQRGRLFLLGLPAVHGQLRPAVADDGDCQPASGGDRPGRGHDVPVAARAERVYALSTAIPFALVVASVFTAGIMSIGMWWQEIGSLQAQLAGPGLSAAEDLGARSSR